MRRKEELIMKKLNLKFEPKMAMTIGLGLLSIAQAVLSTKKEANDRMALKAELKEDIMKDILKDQN
jgi:hypothetical protein